MFTDLGVTCILPDFFRGITLMLQSRAICWFCWEITIGYQWKEIIRGLERRRRTPSFIHMDVLLHHHTTPIFLSLVMHLVAPGVASKLLLININISSRSSKKPGSSPSLRKLTFSILMTETSLHFWLPVSGSPGPTLPDQAHHDHQQFHVSQLCWLWARIIAVLLSGQLIKHCYYSSLSLLSAPFCFNHEYTHFSWTIESHSLVSDCSFTESLNLYWLKIHLKWISNMIS